MMKEESDGRRPAHSHFSDRRKAGIKKRVAHLRLAAKSCFPSNRNFILSLEFVFILIRMIIENRI